MKQRSAAFFFALSGYLVMAGLAHAHHGWGGYKEKLEMSVTVTTVKLGNPHDRLVAVDDDGREWNLLLAPPARNRRFGFGEDSIAVDDRIELYGLKHPSRLEVKVHCLYKDGENIYTYRYDNGRTSLSRVRGETRDDC
jgi:hypothetical protein